MTEFTIKLAEIPISVRCFFDSTKDYCRDYLTDEPGEIQIDMEPLDILAERRLGARQMALEGHSQADYTDAYMETLALYRKIAERLAEKNVLLFHGSVIAYREKAYIFTAKSGTGKTTHCRLWLENIPDCHILNGDKPLLLFRSDGVFACGTPWQGKEQYGRNEILPVAAICLLTRDRSNHIEPIRFSEAFPLLLRQFHKPNGTANAEFMRLFGKLGAVSLYRLGCNMDKEAAFTAFAGLTEGGAEA